MQVFPASSFLSFLKTRFDLTHPARCIHLGAFTRATAEKILEISSDIVHEYRFSSFVPSVITTIVLSLSAFLTVGTLMRNLTVCDSASRTPAVELSRILLARMRVPHRADPRLSALIFISFFVQAFVTTYQRTPGELGSASTRGIRCFSAADPPPP